MESEVQVTEESVYSDMKPDPRVVNLFNSVGVRNRTIIPLRSNGRTFAGFTITRQKPFSAGEIHFLSLMAGPIHDELTTDTIRTLAIQLHDLKSGEIECLKHACHGLTSEQVAGASAYTVETDDLVNEMKSTMDDAWQDEIELDLAPILISTDRAINIGLILTELIINVNKYAYVGSAGPLSVELKQHRNAFRLSVSDRGVGSERPVSCFC